MRKNKIISLLLALTLIGSFAVFALGSGESKTTDQGTGTTEATESNSNLGEYSVEIQSCRLAKDYEGKDVVIVKYGFTNNADNPAAFYTAFDDAVFQNGIGLNKAYVLDDSAKYNDEDKTKEIKTGATLDVEVAYELNDTTTDIEVEIKELFSFNNDVIKKSFSITQ